MRKFFYTAFFWLIFLNLNAQVYPYTEDFQSVNGVGTSCFGDCSNSFTYLSGQGWTGADLTVTSNKWKVNDAYGNLTATPAKGLGTNRFGVGTGITTLEIITPSIGDITSASVLKFDYKIVTGASFNQAYTLAAGEEVKIQISVNGGAFTDIHTFTNANHTATASITPFLTGVSSFDNPDPAAENVKFKFIYKRNDTGNNPVWIFTMDNIKVEDAGADAGAIALSIPTTGCGFTATTPVTFKVKNYGGTSISNVPVQVSVTNGTTTNYNTVVAGPIASGAESSVQTVNVDMSAIGTYTISAQTQLVGDGDASNNATASQNTTNIAPKVINSTTSYSTSFETGDASVAQWTIIDGNEVFDSGNKSRKWTLNNNLATNGTESMYYSSFNQIQPADDWLISPCLQLQTGKTYEVNYKVAVKSAGAAAYGVKIGNSTSTSSFTTTLYTTPASYSTPLDLNSNATFVTQRHTFTVSSNGIYYLAWHATSGVPINSDQINIDQVLVKEVKNTDAELMSFDTPLQNVTNCYSATEDVKVTIRNSGSGALSNIQVTVNVTGPVTQTLSQTVTSLAAGQSQQVTLGQVNMTTQGTYQFAPSITVTGDEDTSNNTLANVLVNGGASSTPVTSVNFTGYTGTTANLNTTFTGWYEKRNDSNYPTFGDGAGSYWRSTNVFSATNGVNAAINMFTGSGVPAFHKNDMIASPLILMGSGGTLTFKVAVTTDFGTGVDNMGSDDTFKVVVLTNCGTTQTTLLTINTANAPDNTINDNTKTVDLSAYNGQIIQIAFVASTGTVSDTQDYDFHLDDINITGAVVGAFTVNLGADQSVCGTGFPIILNANVAGATTYAWTRNGSPIGGNTQTLSVTQAGTYAVSVTKNSVTKTDDIVITQKPDAVASFTSAINNLQVTFTNTSTNASAYTWSFGDGGTSTDTNPTYTYANAGTYTVTLTATSSQGCANGTTTASVTVAPLAIEDEANRYAEVYPNPNTGSFTVRMKEQTIGNTHIEVRDLLGKVIWTKNNVNQEEYLSVKMPQGIYILAIKTDNKIITKRIQIIK
ncbi:MAG: choice-of-anchor J domain-containing protein [Raineya sp.]|jgi:PKD repeat protein|nr:choice-of-anchor J domain-containing protein [Raineya sp.]